MSDPMDLGELIAALEAEDPGLVVPDGFRFPHSYRGYYAEIAFEPARDVTVAQMLGAAREALGGTYEGWKGGHYTMTATTPCWVAVEGSCGEELTAGRLRAMLAAGHDRDGQPDAEVERLRAERIRAVDALSDVGRTAEAASGDLEDGINAELLALSITVDVAEAAVKRVRALDLHEGSAHFPDECRRGCPGCAVAAALDGTEGGQ